MRKNLGAKALLYPEPVLVIATYNRDSSVNAMIAAWGCVSDYDKVTICIDMGHKTAENIKRNREFTVSMANAKNIVALDYLGIVSGNKVADKFTRSGLTAVKSENIHAPIIQELPLALECKLIKYDKNTELVTAQIVNVSADKSILNARGKVDVTKLAPLCYDPEGLGYYSLSKRVGNAFKDGKKIK